MRRDTRTFRNRQGRKALDSENAIRKVSITANAGSDWNIEGYEYVDPETGETICEGDGDDPIPVFQGIGFYARPVGENAEAIMLHVGNQADNPVLAAVRDEDGRIAYVDAFGDHVGGESAVFNGQGTARLKVKADGTIEAGSTGTHEVTIKATTYRTAEDLLLDAIKVWNIAINTLAQATLADAGSKTAIAAALTVINVAIDTMKAGDGGYKTTVFKAE